MDKVRHVKGAKSFSLQAEEVLAELRTEAGSSGDVLFCRGICCFLNARVLSQLLANKREGCGYGQGIPESSSTLLFPFL